MVGDKPFKGLVRIVLQKIRVIPNIEFHKIESQPLSFLV